MAKQSPKKKSPPAEKKAKIAKKPAASKAVTESSKPKSKTGLKVSSKTGSTSRSTAIKRDVEVIEPEIIEPEIIEPESGASGYDPDELRAELESMREVGLTADALNETDFVAGGAVDDGDDEPVELDGRPKLRASSSRKRALPVKVPVKMVDSDSRALTTADPVSIYMAELRKYPLLTKEQERELAVRYRETSDSKAAELLVTSNLRFVVKIAAEYSRFGAKLIDLVQEGNVGLMHAVKEFNPYKGVRLITYAVWWIRGYIQEYLMRQYSLVRIGTTQNQRKLFYRLQKERDALGHEGQEPTVALLAGRLGVSEEEVESMSQRLSGRDVSLSVPVDASSDSSSSLLDFEASGGTPVDDAIGAQEELAVLKENLERIRGSLTEKELYILEKRVLADEPQTLQEIGEHYGVTREAVRQLEARLISKIRKAVTLSLDAHPHPGEDED